MTSEEVFRILRDHFRGLFPKVCSNCGRRFDSLHEYIHTTTPRGTPVSFDADLEDWETPQPIGSLAYADCPCGNTLALGTQSMALPTRLALLEWVREQCETRHVTASEVLAGLRQQIREGVLQDPPPPPPPPPSPPHPRPAHPLTVPKNNPMLPLTLQGTWRGHPEPTGRRPPRRPRPPGAGS